MIAPSITMRLRICGVFGGSTISAYPRCRAWAVAALSSRA